MTIRGYVSFTIMVSSGYMPGSGIVYAEYIMRNTGLEEAQAGIKIAGRGEISITSDMQMTPPLWQKVKRN